MSAAVSYLPQSIQGEEALLRPVTSGFRQADDAAVERYVANARPEVLECRASGRHDYRSRLRNTARGVLDFTGYDEALRLFEIREDCGCCGLAYRIRYYENQGTARRPDIKWVGNSATKYKTGPGGERYTLLSGHGRMSPGQVDGAMVNRALSGKTLAEIKKQAREAGTRQEEN